MKKTFKPGDRVVFYNPKPGNTQKIKLGKFVRHIKPHSWVRRLALPRWCLVQFIGNKGHSRVMVRDLELDREPNAPEAAQEK